jgi:fatty-acid desaturase
MWFIASLLTAIGAVYLYEKSEKLSAELAIACVAVALTSLILTLIAAPWPIQLAIVILALVSYRFTKMNPIN